MYKAKYDNVFQNSNK